MAQGFRSATVEFRIEDVSKTEKKVVFVIDEGDKVKIESIDFEGNTVISDRRLRSAMKKTKVDTCAGGSSRTRPTYSQANYDEDVESIKALYQSKGYKDVVVKDPKIDIFVKDPNAKPKKIKRRARITIPLVEGDRFFTGGIRVVRVNQGGQPADPPTTTVIPADVILKDFYELPPGSVLNRDRIVEALSADRDEVQVPRVHLLVRGPDLSRGRRPQGRHRVEGLRGRQVLPRPPRSPGKHHDPRQGNPP